MIADTTGPKPIPGGFSAAFKPAASNAVAHIFQPAEGVELNTIGDFNGFVAAAEIQQGERQRRHGLQLAQFAGGQARHPPRAGPQTLYIESSGLR